MTVLLWDGSTRTRRALRNAEVERLRLRDDGDDGGDVLRARLDSARRAKRDAGTLLQEDAAVAQVGEQRGLLLTGQRLVAVLLEGRVDHGVPAVDVGARIGLLAGRRRRRAQVV